MDVSGRLWLGYIGVISINNVMIHRRCPDTDWIRLTKIGCRSDINTVFCSGYYYYFVRTKTQQSTLPSQSVDIVTFNFQISFHPSSTNHFKLEPSVS